MKHFTKLEPTEIQSYGKKFKQYAVIKRFQTEDGLLHEFTTLGKPGERASGVIALTKDKQVIITYQFRAGPERWMFDIPGGSLNDGEDPKRGAIRELVEESGYRPGTIELLGTSCRDAYMNYTWFYYLATDCTEKPEDRALDREENEQGAEVRLITIAELIQNAKTDQMGDPVAVLMAYEKLREMESSND